MRLVSSSREVLFGQRKILLDFGRRSVALESLGDRARRRAHSLRGPWKAWRIIAFPSPLLPPQSAGRAGKAQNPRRHPPAGSLHFHGARGIVRLQQFLELLFPLRQGQIAGQSLEFPFARCFFFEQIEQSSLFGALFAKLFRRIDLRLIQQPLNARAFQVVLIRQLRFPGFQRVGLLNTIAVIGIQLPEPAQIRSQSIDLKFQAAGRAGKTRLGQAIFQKLVQLRGLIFQP